MKIYPHYPKPVTQKVSMVARYFNNEKSWLSALYERSYTMKLGHFKIPLLDLYIANEPSLVHRIMVSEAKQFPKHHLGHIMLKPLLGESIFTTNGPVWKKYRELLNPSFEMVRIEHVFELMHNASKDMLIRFEYRDSSEYEDIDHEMSFTTADIIFRTILSKELTKAEGKKMIDAFMLFQESGVKIAMQNSFKIPQLLRRKKTARDYTDSSKLIRDELAKIIEPRYKAMVEDKQGDEKDILSSMLTVKDETTDKPFSFNEILDQVAMLFLAGHETSASSMTWTLYLMALYPHYQEEAYQEVMNVCGNEPFTIENTKKFDFLTKVFKESLRLYPPVSFFPRETTEEKTVMRNKILKKGAAVVVSPWLMHRNSRYWEDPHMFDPHRFDNPENITKYTYFPFGMGPRICIGAGFAMQEGALLLASILRTYKLELKPGFVPGIAGRLTTRCLNGMPIKLIKRTNI